MPDLHDDSFRIAKYLYDNKCIGEKSIVASQLREAVNLPSSDFDPADQYLLGMGYVHGTMGGEAGQRWLEPRGIEFVKSKLSHAQQGPAQIPMVAASVKHVEVASPLLRLIAILGGLLGAIGLVGGIYLALAQTFADTKFNLFGNQLSSTSVGVSIAFIGGVLVILTFRRVLRAIERLAALPRD